MAKSKLVCLNIVKDVLEREASLSPTKKRPVELIA
jgi:hypothetical protein